MQDPNLNFRQDKGSKRTSASGRIIKTPKILMTTSSDDASSRKKPQYSSQVLDDKLRTLRAQFKEIENEMREPKDTCNRKS